MPGKSSANGRRSGAGSPRGTLADSSGRMRAVRQPTGPALNAEDEAYSRRALGAHLGRSEDWSSPAELDLDDSYGERDEAYFTTWDDHEHVEVFSTDSGWDDEYPTPTERSRARSLARPLTPAPLARPEPLAPEPQRQVAVPLSQESAPELIAYRPPSPRIRGATERLIQSARKSARDPWTRVRLILALVAAILGFLHAPLRMGEASQPLQVAQASMSLAPGASITSQVQPETQLKRPDLYDNYAQFQLWGGAACSAAAMSEVLTAYGVRGATIGHEIDEFGSYISPNWGLLNHHAFAVIAAKHRLRADESNAWTYNQIVYASERLGIPVIVNVRISYGYYSFFSGGHFLVVVGGDSQGLAIVDSSEYYIHYLPRDVFYQMFTGYTAAIVPGDDQYTLPSN
ncbi:MAG TPA: C39 family peptidase [Ktedonobacterales bacterium]